MKNLELLFDKNRVDEKKEKIRKKLKIECSYKNGKKVKIFKYVFQDRIWQNKQILELISVVNYVDMNYKAIKYPLCIAMGSVRFEDKMVYILLEAIYVYVRTFLNRELSLMFVAQDTIWTEGISCSPLINMQINGDRFCEVFAKDISPNHFRRICYYEKVKEDETHLSNLTQDISYFLKNSGLEDETRLELTEVISELLVNSAEHSQTDCLVDLDITSKQYIRADGDSDEIFFGLNVVVMNFSDNLFYEPLMNKMERGMYLPEQYNKIYEAEKYHSQYFNEKYTREDFYMFASFQHNISGNIEKGVMGGKGLTSLLKALGDRSADQYCYMFSGESIILLKKSHMKFNNTNMIGFNEQNDFINAIPEEGILIRSQTYFPGTVYNLSFVIRKEWNLSE